MKKRIVKEKVSKDFLLDLLEPFHPTMKLTETIVDIDIDVKGGVITYTIIH